MATTLPELSFDGPPEAFAAMDSEKGCGSPLVEQPGVAAWRDLLLARVGGRSLGIVRACDSGGASEHKTGRAFDWGVKADDPAEKALADGVLEALLADDAELFRRLGLMYVIWNRQVWSVQSKTWHAYSGSSPHTDHVHFSFGWPGALAQTSYFRALGVAPGTKPGSGSHPGAPWSAVGVVLALGAGAALGWYGARMLAHSVSAR